MTDKEPIYRVLRFISCLQDQLPGVDPAGSPTNAAREAYANAMLLIKTGLLEEGTSQ